MLRNIKKSANYADIYAIMLLSIFERQGSLPCHTCGAVGFYHFLLAVLNWSTPHGPDSACEIDVRDCATRATARRHLTWRDAAALCGAGRRGKARETLP